MADKQIDVLLKLQSDLSELKEAERGINGFYRNVARGIQFGLGINLASELSDIPRKLGEMAMGGISFNEQLEQSQLSFVTLLGSMDAAKKRIEDITAFAAKTPFAFAELVESNKLLETFTGGLLTTDRGMRLVGDAASIAKEGIADVSFWLGRLVNGLQNGDPIGEALMRLSEMALISGDGKRELEALSGTAVSNARIMDLLGSALSRTTGAMDLQAQSLGGLKSTLFDVLEVRTANLMEGVTATLKDAIRELLEFLGELPDAVEKATQGVRQRTENALESAIGAIDLSAGEESLRKQLDAFVSRLDSVRSEISKVSSSVGTEGGLSFDFAGSSLKSVEELRAAKAEVAEMERSLILLKSALSPYGKDTVFADLLTVDELDRRVSALQRAQEELDGLKAKLAASTLTVGESGASVVSAYFGSPQDYLDAQSRAKALQNTLAGTDLPFLEKQLQLRTRDPEKDAESKTAELKDADQIAAAKKLYQDLQDGAAKVAAEREKALAALHKENATLEEQLAIIDREIQARADQGQADLALVERLSDAKAKADARGKVELRVEGELLSLSAERVTLAKQLAAQRQKESEAEASALLRTSELELDHARSIREGARTYAERADAIEAEGELLGALIIKLATARDIAADPSARAEIEARIAAYQRQIDALDELDKTRFERDQEKFAKREDPRSSYQNGNEAVLGALMNQAAEFGTVWDQVNEQVNVLVDTLESSLSDALFDSLTGAQELDEAMKSLGLSLGGAVLRSITDVTSALVTQMLTTYLTAKLVKKKDTDDNKKKGAEDFASAAPAALATSISSYGLAALVGGAAFAAAYIALPALAGAREMGGSVYGGGRYLVGERGPEILDVPASGNIVPNHQLAQAGGGGAQVNIGVFGSKGDAESWLKTRQGEAWLVDFMGRNAYKVIPGAT